MSSTFMGFNISRSGMAVNQKGLNTVSHNISNANTEGYTRQVVSSKAVTPEVIPGINGTVGQGVDIQDIKQIRNEFLDYSYRGENYKYGEFSKKFEILNNIEGIFNEPSDSGITTIVNDFYSALQELNKSPDSLTVRALVRERGVEITKGLNHLSNALSKLQSDVNFEVKTVITQINGYAKQISDLNGQIYKIELDGTVANDLRDQRNLLLDKMSNFVKIEYSEDSLNRFHLSIQGREIVNHQNSNELVFSERMDKNNEEDVDKLYEISWKDGSTFSTEGGLIKGLLEMRDNLSGDTKGIPYYINKIDEFTDVLMNEFNNIHSSGFDLKGEKGVLFFTENNMNELDYKNYLKNFGLNKGLSIDVTESVLNGTIGLTDIEKEKKIKDNISDILKNSEFTNKSIKYIDNQYYITDKIKASNVSISKDLNEDLNKFATASTNTGLPGNSKNVLKLMETRHNMELYDWGSVDDFLKTFSSNLGVDGQDAKRISQNQEMLLSNITTRRDTVSGVSLDEEMGNMMMYQHAYNANARMMTTLDGILDTLINRVGLVGR